MIMRDYQILHLDKNWSAFIAVLYFSHSRVLNNDIIIS